MIIAECQRAFLVLEIKIVWFKIVICLIMLYTLDHFHDLSYSTSRLKLS